MKPRRTLVFAVLFWAAAFAFVAIDWVRAAAHCRQPWWIVLAQPQGAEHCAAKAK